MTYKTEREAFDKLHITGAGAPSFRTWSKWNSVEERAAWEAWQARAAIAQPAASVASFTTAELQEAREYLDAWGCLAHPAVRRLLESAEAATAQLQPRTPAEPKCQNCDGKGGFITAEWVDPVSGPETEGERCEECDGSGLAPQPRTLDAPVSDAETQAAMEGMHFTSTGIPRVDDMRRALEAFAAGRAVAQPAPVQIPDDLDFVLPEVGSQWSHSNGDTYTVTGYADLHSDNHKRKPPRVIYQSAKTARVWSRELSDWRRAMTPAAPTPPKGEPA